MYIYIYISKKKKKYFQKNQNIFQKKNSKKKIPKKKISILKKNIFKKKIFSKKYFHQKNCLPNKFSPKKFSPQKNVQPKKLSSGNVLKWRENWSNHFSDTTTPPPFPVKTIFGQNLFNSKKWCQKVI